MRGSVIGWEAFKVLCRQLRQGSVTSFAESPSDGEIAPALQSCLGIGDP